jgi:mercuric ion binding protein
MRFKCTIFLVLLPLCANLSVLAKSTERGEQHEHSTHSQKDHNHLKQKLTLEKVDSDKLLIKVQGMVCAFCAQGIKKKFNARDEVKKTEVDLDTMEVEVTIKKGKVLSEMVIKEIITNAGFKFVGLKK